MSQVEVGGFTAFSTGNVSVLMNKSGTPVFTEVKVSSNSGFDTMNHISNGSYDGTYTEYSFNGTNGSNCNTRSGVGTTEKIIKFYKIVAGSWVLNVEATCTGFSSGQIDFNFTQADSNYQTTLRSFV